MSTDQILARMGGVLGTSTDTALAKALDVAKTTLSSWRDRDHVPYAECVRLAEERGVSLDWLIIGRLPKTPSVLAEEPPAYTHARNTDEAGYVGVPVYDVRAAAGGGALVQEEQIVDVLKFKSEWIRIELHANPSDLYLIYVDGDSMMPTLMSGDLILVDRRTASSVPREGVYLLRLHDTLIVKRLQRLPDGRINVTSDNHAYAPFSIAPNEQDNMAIIGRVVWAGRRM